MDEPPPTDAAVPLCPQFMSMEAISDSIRRLFKSGGGGPTIIGSTKTRAKAYELHGEMSDSASNGEPDGGPAAHAATPAAAGKRGQL